MLHDIQQQFPGKTAALVIVWGTAGPCDSCAPDSNDSSQLAEDVAPLLPQWDPSFFPAYSPKIIRGYWDGKGTRNTLRIEMFFIV